MAIFLTSIAIIVLLFFVLKQRRDFRKLRENYELLEEEGKVLFGSFHKLVSEIGAGADKASIYARMLRTLCLSCNASSACIYERNSQGKLFVAASDGIFPSQRKISEAETKQFKTRAELIASLMEGEDFEFGEGIIGKAAQSKQPVFIKDMRASESEGKHKDSLLKITSLIVVPIYFRDEFYGVIAVANPINMGFFSESDYSVARSIADQAALLLYSVNIFSQLVEKSKMDFDLSLASSVQSYILPETFSNVGGCEIASRYIPQQKVGGDFYDTFKLSEDKIAVVIGDVSGKGISAALVMTIAQTMFRYIAKGFEKPSEALKEFNSKMYSAMRKDMFITLVYAIIDTACGKIIMARAGHEKPILSSKANGTNFLNSRGAAIGMFEPKIFDSTISDIEFDFNEGDSFVLYTDGVTEAVNLQGEEFSTERLKGIIEQNADLSAEDLNEKITSKVKEFSNGASLTDDYTLVSVRRNKH